MEKKARLKKAKVLEQTELCRPINRWTEQREVYTVLSKNSMLTESMGQLKEEKKVTRRKKEGKETIRKKENKNKFLELQA